MSESNRGPVEEGSNTDVLLDPEAAIQEPSTQYDPLTGELSRVMTTRGSRTDPEYIRRKNDIRDSMALIFGDIETLRGIISTRSLMLLTSSAFQSAASAAPTTIQQVSQQNSAEPNSQVATNYGRVVTFRYPTDRKRFSRSNLDIYHVTDFLDQLEDLCSVISFPREKWHQALLVTCEPRSGMN
jgi:hypothetical protein